MLKRPTLQPLFLLICCISAPISCNADILPGLVSFTMTEDSKVPLLLGDVLDNLLPEMPLHKSVASVLIFPSSQPFSEYFQLVQKRRAGSYKSQTMISSELQLIKPFDLETACKKRLSLHQCSQANYGCCCDHRSLFCSIKLQLAVTIGGSIFQTAAQQTPFKAFRIEVKILDLNDQTPVFTPDIFALKLSEGVKHDDKYRLPVARDGDLGQNAEVTYSIASIHGRAPNSKKWQPIPKGNEVFSLNSGPQPLLLVINGYLDREEIELYKILIEAEDMPASVELRKTGTLTLTLIVTDVNDVSPTFQSPNITIDVVENSVNGTVVCTILAQDYDSGVNGRIHYSISQHQRGYPFYIDSETGLMTVAGQIDRERDDEYRILVEAADNGTPARTSTLPVFVRVLDINDNAPSISISSVLVGNSSFSSSSEEAVVLHVPESLPVGSCIANVSVTDSDLAENTTIFCHVSEETFELHSISQWSYSLRLAKSLDYETKRHLQIKISCEDLGRSYSLKSEAIVEAIVLNENDSPPVFQNPLVIPPAWLVNNTDVAQFSTILGNKTNESPSEMVDDFIVFIPKSFPLGDAFLRFRATDEDFNYESEEKVNKMHFALSIYKEQHFQPESHSLFTISPNKASLFSFSESNGEVFLTSAPNLDGTISVYKGEVVAQDSTAKPLSTRKNLTFIVAENNLNAPIIRIFNFALANSLSPYQIFDQEQNLSIQEVPFYIPRQSPLNSMIGQVVGSDSDLGQSGHVTYDLTFKRLSCIDVAINKSTGLLTLVTLNASLSSECQLKALLNVADNGFPRRNSYLHITFQLFDASRLSPKIWVNQSIIPANQTATNELVWYFQSILPKIGKSLFRVDVNILPGLIEPSYKMKLCTPNYEIFPPVPMGLSIEEKTGAVYVTDSLVKLSSYTVYITVSNRYWPSLPSSIYKTEIDVSESGATTVRILPVENIDCKFHDVTEIDLSSSRRNFTAFCISTFSGASFLSVLVVVLVVLLKKSGGKPQVPSMRKVLNKKAESSLYDQKQFKKRLNETVETVKVEEQCDTCSHSKKPTLALATKIVNVPKMILKPPLLASASGTVRIDRNQASALTITRLASVYPPLSELSGAYYMVGNIHEGEMKSQIHQQKGMASSDNNCQSPSDGKIIVQEQNVSGVTGHANVNIIVHNNFEKALPTEQLGGMRAGDKLTKMFCIDPNLQKVGANRNAIRIKIDPLASHFIQDKDCCE
ncbi:protocadherin gamma c6 [Echinococcus multilocularis]|uniref:Protocadherin gamma c6 n=1 Tax=Echinococcus multilocularis TaxID=6211 RepID=A0A068YAX6_ECHMU|nr:protocadherin gamma c6 [Echinococcus multilocularis]